MITALIKVTRKISKNMRPNSVSGKNFIPNQR